MSLKNVSLPVSIQRSYRKSSKSCIPSLGGLSLRPQLLPLPLPPRQPRQPLPLRLPLPPRQLLRPSPQQLQPQPLLPLVPLLRKPPPLIQLPQRL
uniref:IGFBP N-terminal domain-containing protein n=1 Tax=Ascaris lumbricoides TaxID=6252 RepID=A0A0M3IU07_ASCLU